MQHEVQEKVTDQRTQLEQAKADLEAGLKELTPKLSAEDFTIETVGARFARVGDLWAAALGERNTAADLKALTTR